MIEQGPVRVHNVLIPRDARSFGCQLHRCMFEVIDARIDPDTREFDAFAPDGMSLRHTPDDGRADTMFLPIRTIQDMTVCIWGEIVRPWLERLHEEPMP